MGFNAAEFLQSLVGSSENRVPASIGTVATKKAACTESLSGVEITPTSWDDCIEPPDPCSKCGGLAFWWNARGQHFCLGCDPPTEAVRLLEHAQRIRKKNRLPCPSGAEDMVQELKRLAG